VKKKKKKGKKSKRPKGRGRGFEGRESKRIKSKKKALPGGEIGENHHTFLWEDVKKERRMNPTKS